MPYEDTLAARFAAKVERQPNGCLLWTGATNRDGYGTLHTSRGTQLAHRAAWRLATGAWPTQNVLHTCDTPPCVEHGHHFLGTHADNRRDCVAKGRNNTPRGGAAARAKLSDRQASEVRRRMSGAPHGMATQVAWEYGISDVAVHKIVSGRTHNSC